MRAILRAIMQGMKAILVAILILLGIAFLIAGGMAVDPTATVAALCFAMGLFILIFVAALTNP